MERNLAQRNWIRQQWQIGTDTTTVTIEAEGPTPTPSGVLRLVQELSCAVERYLAALPEPPARRHGRVDGAYGRTDPAEARRQLTAAREALREGRRP